MNGHNMKVQSTHRKVRNDNKAGSERKTSRRLGRHEILTLYLARKDAYPEFEGTVNSHIRNPRVELRTDMDEILSVDAVIVTHTHSRSPGPGRGEPRAEAPADVRLLSNGVSLVKNAGPAWDR